MNRFVSGLAPQIQSLLEIKHAMGLPYEVSERHLLAFDTMGYVPLSGGVCLDTVQVSSLIMLP